MEGLPGNTLGSGASSVSSALPSNVWAGAHYPVWGTHEQTAA